MNGFSVTHLGLVSAGVWEVFLVQSWVEHVSSLPK